MLSMHVVIPDSLSYLMEKFILAGVFHSKEEMLLTALSDFVQKNQLELLDYFANQDIDWALAEKANIT
jgi:hypothetical protein